jgi:hypothetical protein
MTNTEKYLGLGLLVILLVLVLFLSIHQRVFGSASTLGTNNIPIVLSGGSAPTVFNALEATESFISDGTLYFLSGKTQYNSVTAATGQVITITPPKALVAATTTPCAIQNPSSTASSSIVWFGANLSTATSTAGSYVVGTSTTAFATTTTMIGITAIGAGNTPTITWDPGVNNSVLGPSQWIVFGIAATGSVNYGYTYGGTCAAEFLTFQ